MKIIATNSALHSKQNEKQNKSPNFKSGGFLGLTANVMQGIENQGYLASFLIQDGLGMTLPRTWTGFNRDKEITGKWNTQEGLEVLGREGMTGPYMIAVAPAVLWATTKFCRSTNTNTNLIKRFGQNLKDFVKDSKFDKTIKEDAAKFKKEFSQYALEKYYRQSVTHDKDASKTLEIIFKEFENLSSKDKKVKNESLNKIVNLINEKMLETTSEFYSLNKLSVGEKKSKKIFDSKEVITALNDFCDDAIINNPNAKSIDEVAAENIKNNFVTKRLLTNIANVAITLGGLSVLPKIYAKSDIAPGAKTLEHLKQQNENNANNANTNNVENIGEVDEVGDIDNSKSEISFKGRGINSNGVVSDLGKFLSKTVPEKVNELFEYTGYNFSKSMFAALSIFGLLAPRGKRAWDRAQVDEHGKKDLTELNEILLRDTVSSLSVVFAVPILTKVFVNAYENKLGFILTNKASDGKNSFKKFLDVINPYSDLEVLSIAQLDAIYGNIDSKAKLMNFAKFIDKKGGDLEKILSKSENVSEMFNESSFTLDSIKDLTKKEKNKKIIELFNKIKVSDNNAKNEVIAKLMKGSGEIKNNKIAQAARGLYSLPGMISTFIISPVLLGILIPMLTYHNTRKAHEKIAQQKAD